MWFFDDNFEQQVDSIVEDPIGQEVLKKAIHRFLEHGDESIELIDADNPGEEYEIYTHMVADLEGNEIIVSKNNVRHHVSLSIRCAPGSNLKTAARLYLETFPERRGEGLQ